MILSRLPIESPAHSEKLEGICFHRRMGQFVNAISNSIWQHSQKVILAPCTTHCSFTEEHYSPSVNKSSQAHHGLYQLLPVHDYCPQLDSNEPPNSAFFGRWTTLRGNSQSCPPARKAPSSRMFHGVFLFPSCWIRHTIKNKYIRPSDVAGIRLCQTSLPWQTLPVLY